MIKALKSHWAFTGRGYRFVVLFLFPLLAVLAMVITGMIQTELMPLVSCCYYIIFMIVEPMSDYWFLGGFYSKNKGAFKFMQSSNQFARVIRDVVIVDLIRRVVLNLFIFCIMVCGGIIADIEPEGYLLFAFFPILEILLAEVAALIGRHFDLWNQYYAVVLLCYIVVSVFLAYSIINLQEFLWLVCLLSAFVAVILAVVIVSYTNKKVRESYYDK